MARRFSARSLPRTRSPRRNFRRSDRLRTLSPWDREAVFDSVKKTSRVIVALRGFAVVGLRRRDRGGDRGRVLRVARCAGEAGCVGRYVRRLRAAARGRDPAAGRRRSRGVRRDREVLAERLSAKRRPDGPPFFWLNYKARDPRCQRHRIQISDNCVKTDLGGVMARAVVYTRTRPERSLRSCPTSVIYASDISDRVLCFFYRSR